MKSKQHASKSGCSSADSSLASRATLWLLMAATGLGVHYEAFAQTSPLLYAQTITVFTDGPVRFTFRDEGTGATNYIVQFSPTVEQPDSWEAESTAIITALGAGVFQVDVPQAPQPNGFFRVMALRSTGPVVANFADPSLEVTEGGTVQVVINLSAPFTGALRYTISGTAGQGDYAPLSGEVQVTNSMRATIPVALTDNLTIGELKYLSLRLEQVPGLSIGSQVESRLAIQDNDADWRGTLSIGKASLGFVLRISENKATIEGSLNSTPAGLFPLSPVPTSVVFTAAQFQSSSLDMPVTADATLLQTPATMDLWLEAANGNENQSVSPNEIRGVARLFTRFAGKPYLNTTNSGSFYLVKPSVSPPTQRLELAVTP